MYPGQPRTRCVVEDDVEILVLLPPPPRCWDYRLYHPHQHHPSLWRSEEKTLGLKGKQVSVFSISGDISGFEVIPSEDAVCCLHFWSASSDPHHVWLPPGGTDCLSPDGQSLGHLVLLLLPPGSGPHLNSSSVWLCFCLSIAMGAFKRACGGHHTSIDQSKVESLGVYEAVWEPHLPS